MLNDSNLHSTSCARYNYLIRTCIAQNTATRQIILDAILLPVIFALLKFVRRCIAGYIGGTQAE